MPFRMNVARLHVGPLFVQMAVPVLLRMHIPRLQLCLRAVPLAIVLPWRMHLPGLRVKSRSVVPLPTVVALRMDVPGSLMIQPDDPPASLVPLMLMPCPVVLMDDEGTVVRISQSHADADPVPVPGTLAGRRAEQPADDAADNRSFPRPFVIRPGGRRRHGRAEYDGRCERDSSDEALFPVLHHRHSPFLIGSL